MRSKRTISRTWLQRDFRQAVPRALAFLLVASLGVYFFAASHAASLATSSEAESGVLSGSAATISDSSASGGNAVKFGTSSGGSGLNCTNPVYSANWPPTDYAGWTDANGTLVQNDVMTGATGSNSQQLNVCSATNWNVVSNLAEQNGSINAYPDTSYTLTDKPISQYTSLQTCYGMKEPVPTGPTWPTAGGSEWDYAYDVWINKTTGEDIWANDIEIMVWNDWTDTSIYPPSNARAVTIDGIAYHMWNPWGSEWIYTRDTKTTSGCLDMLNIMKDLIAHDSAAAGITSASAPQHLEYGVEISGTHGTQTFQITNASLTVK